MAIDVVNLVGLSFVKVWILLVLSMLLLSRSRSTSAANLHALLLLVVLGLALVPVLVGTIPGINLRILPSSFSPELYWSHRQNSGSRIFTLIGSGYLLVVALLWLRRLLQIRQVFALVRRARPLAIDGHTKLLSRLRASLAIKRQIRVRYSDQIVTPMTLGTFRPWILLPRESLVWDEDRLRRFFLHELAHVARNDWFVKQIAYGIVAAFWILPPAWKALKKLDWLAELACDDVVIAAEGRRSDYADDLLDMTANPPLAGAVGLTEAHNHYDRIAAVLDGARIRQSSLRKLWAHALVFFLVLLGISGTRIDRRAPVSPIEDYILQPLVILPVAPHTLLQQEADIQNTEDNAAGPPELPFAQPQLEYTENLAGLMPPQSVWDKPPALPKLELLQPLVKIIPEYPRRALQRSREGVVELTFSVLPNGETAQIEVVRAEPAGLFDKAAVNAIKQYRYAPRENELHGMSEVFEFKLIEDAH